MFSFIGSNTLLDRTIVSDALLDMPLVSGALLDMPLVKIYITIECTCMFSSVGVCQGCHQAITYIQIHIKGQQPDPNCSSSTESDTPKHCLAGDWWVYWNVHSSITRCEMGWKVGLFVKICQVIALLIGANQQCLQRFQSVKIVGTCGQIQVEYVVNGQDNNPFKFGWGGRWIFSCSLANIFNVIFVKTIKIGYIKYELNGRVNMLEGGVDIFACICRRGSYSHWPNFSNTPPPPFSTELLFPSHKNNGVGVVGTSIIRHDVRVWQQKSIIVSPSFGHFCFQTVIDLFDLTFRQVKSICLSYLVPEID